MLPVAKNEIVIYDSRNEQWNCYGTKISVLHYGRQKWCMENLWHSTVNTDDHFVNSMLGYNVLLARTEYVYIWCCHFTVHQNFCPVTPKCTEAIDETMNEQHFYCSCSCFTTHEWNFSHRIKSQRIFKFIPKYSIRKFHFGIDWFSSS